MKLYHGILKKNLENMLKYGVHSPSYWGTKSIALAYSDCNKIIEIDSEDYEVLSNETLAEHYALNDPGEDKYMEWQESNQTWQDSLEIFDSVIIEDEVFFDESNILEED